MPIIMPVDLNLPEIEIDQNTEYFLRWTVEKYHYEMDWDRIREHFEETSALVRQIAKACIDAGNFGSTEFKAVCHAANIKLTREKLQDYIREFELPEETETELLEAVPESFGIVGGALMDITVKTEQAEGTLLQAFATLLDDSSTEEELLDAVEEIAGAETKGVKAGRLTPVLSLLWPELFPINNGPTRAVMNDYFGFDISDSLKNYRAEIPMYLAVRKEFGFYGHGRDFDRYCHWARDETESDVVTWFEQNGIADRTAWQINAGRSNNGESEKLWSVWREHGICSIGWDATDLSALSEAELEDQAAQWDSSAVEEYYKRFSRELAPGQLVIAKSGYDLLGIGVSKQGGYHYCDEFIETETGIHHPHAWPIEWVVIPDDVDTETGDWDLSPGLQSRTTLMRTNAFEQIRFILAQKEPELIPDLSELERLITNPPTATLPEQCTETGSPESITDPAPYYWVNQSQAEIDGEYLQAPTDDRFQYDLPKLEVGDIVFSYVDGKVVGYHEVTKPAREIEIAGDEATAYDGTEETVQRYRVETDFAYFAEALAFADVFPTLWEHRLDQYYPVNPDGINQQYLFNLSEAAGDYLLRKGMGGVEQYDGITEAEEDVRARLDEDRDSRELLISSLVTSRIEAWTAVLRRNDFVGKSVQRSDYDTVAEIKTAYETNEHRLSELATRLGVGSLGDCSPGQVLFIILFRDLQREAGISEQRVNLNHVKLPHILNETYLTEDTIPPVETPPDAASDLRRQLTDKGQLVFHGPPGTGKTYTAKQFARWWLRLETDEPHAEQLETVTFHPSFTYEDFIEGLEARERDGAVEYRVEPGIFRTFVDRAAAAYEETPEDGSAPPYLLIIDEINRGNLAQIFGETITLLEQDKRLDADNETTIRLPHSGERFTIPPNLYVIGTMNTADRSIALVDAALRRRFRFVHFPPSIETLCEQYGFSDPDAVRTAAESASDSARQLLALSICAVDALNGRIRSSPDLGRGKQLGHTSLLGIDQEKPLEERRQAILDRWYYEIMPMLEEYYFGQFERIDEELFEGEGERLFDTETQEIRDFNAEDLVSACTHILTDVDVDGTASTAAGD
jgi:hypothetical protein